MCNLRMTLAEIFEGGQGYPEAIDARHAFSCWGLTFPSIGCLGDNCGNEIALT